MTPLRPLATFAPVMAIDEDLEQERHQRNLFLASSTAQNAVYKIEKAQISRMIKANVEGSSVTRALLSKLGQRVRNIADICIDDVIIVHKRSSEDSATRHAFISMIEDIMGSSVCVTIEEVSNTPRNLDSHEMKVKLDAKQYPNMGIYKATSMYLLENFNEAIRDGQVFKLNISREDVEIAINSVIMNTQYNREIPFYGDTYNCNNFVHDVLKTLHRHVHILDDIEGVE